MPTQVNRSTRLRRGNFLLAALLWGTVGVAKAEADIAVWDANMYTIPAEKLHDLKCTVTLLHGQTVFDSNRP